MSRCFVFAFACLTVTACVESRPCSENPESPACDPWICCTSSEVEGCDPVEIAARCGAVDGGRDAGFDAGRDAGTDAGRDAGDGGADAGRDAGPCGGMCSGETPECDEETDTCICTDDATCTSVDEARCDDGVCAGCDDDDQCIGAGGGEVEVCDTVMGTCVGCLRTADCDSGESCNLLTRVCEPAPAPRLSTCASCTNDDQCMDEHRCVRMQFMGVDRDPGFYCLLQVDAPGDCPRPTTSATPARESINGVAAETYCAPNEDSISCEAVTALLNDWHCDTGVDGQCYPAGEPGMAVAIPGARCEDLGGLSDRCTYTCGGAVTACPAAGSGASCGASPEGYCGE